MAGVSAEVVETFKQTVLSAVLQSQGEALLNVFVSFMAKCGARRGEGYIGQPSLGVYIPNYFK